MVSPSAAGDVRVTALYTYPIKGCYRVERDRASVEPWGLDGDRRWMVVAADGEAITQREAAGLTGVRPVPHRGGGAGGLLLRAAGRPDLVVPEPAGGDPVPVSVFGQPLTAAYAGDEARRWFTTLLDQDARLVWLDDPTRRPVYPLREAAPERVSFADGFPLALASTASLEALNGWLTAQAEEPVPMTRFRPNVVISGARAWQEDDWTGGRIRIGAVTFRVPEPIPRCLVTTTDQETGERGKEPLRVLNQYRNVDQKLLFAMNLIPDGLDGSGGPDGLDGSGGPDGPDGGPDGPDGGPDGPDGGPDGPDGGPDGSTEIAVGDRVVAL